MDQLGGKRRPIVYTIGHSSRGLGEFIGILRRYGVRVVVDVRSRPGSRRVPWFSRKVMEERLAKAGIEYLWLGDLLGGLRDEPPYYPEYMETSTFRRGIGVLVSLAASLPGRVAFMCRERYWLNCHRAYIAETLHHLGFNVIHIVDIGQRLPHRELGVRPQWLRTPLYLEGLEVSLADEG